MTLSKTILRVLAVGTILSSVIPGAWSQTKPAAQAVKKPAVKSSSAKPEAKTAVKATTKPTPKAAAKVTPKAAATSAPVPAAPATVSVANKRDPFRPLISDKKDTGLPDHLPPGKAGLVVATVRVDGTIKSPEGMLAMVSNPEQHVYFIHEGDQLYDGDVEKIAIDGVTFRENSKDAFGKPVERLITKRLYPSAGEQQ